MSMAQDPSALGEEGRRPTPRRCRSKASRPPGAARPTRPRPAAHGERPSLGLRGGGGRWLRPGGHRRVQTGLLGAQGLHGGGGDALGELNTWISMDFFQLQINFNSISLDFLGSPFNFIGQSRPFKVGLAGEDHLVSARGRAGVGDFKVSLTPWR